MDLDNYSQSIDMVNVVCYLKSNVFTIEELQVKRCPSRCVNDMMPDYSVSRGLSRPTSLEFVDRRL